VEWPQKRFRVKITERILNQELKTEYEPNSAGVIKRVKIGVEIIAIPFCKNEQSKNQNDAFTTDGRV
jgi:hypothetical protein